MAVGKEGDIYVVKDDAGDSRVLKMHRCVLSLGLCDDLFRPARVVRAGGDCQFEVRK